MPNSDAHFLTVFGQKFQEGLKIYLWLIFAVNLPMILPLIDFQRNENIMILQGIPGDIKRIACTFSSWCYEEFHNVRE